MPAPAIVMNDRITGMCPIHLIPNPASGIPQPGPPFPFSAPLVMNVATTVMIGGKPAATMGSSGYNLPPHVGLHPADPYMVPTLQEGRVLSGSMTVLIEGKPAATATSSVKCCATPGSLVPSVADVLIG